MVNRWIILADMNSFFASVHQAEDISLRGRPVIVTGDPDKRRGIVLTASYEAKKYGVKTGMLIWEAKKLVPDAVFIKAEHDKYLQYSMRILKIMRDFTPLVEPFSIDEAFMDVTGCEDLFGSPMEIAKKLKDRIKNEVGVMCSVGISTNKLLAKMAAELEKPDGLTMLLPEEVPHRLWPLPAGELFGVGPRIERRLDRLGIKTIGDIAKCPVEILKREFGAVGAALHMAAKGIDCSPVNPESLNVLKGVSNRYTLPKDCRGEEIKVAVVDLCEKVVRRARKGGYVGKCVGLTLRDTDLFYYHWTKRLPEYTDITEDVIDTALELLYSHWLLEKPVRLVGVSFTELVKKKWEQPDIFGRKKRLGQLARTCDFLKDRYGENSVQRAVLLEKKSIFA
ncbi:MAG: DNA polymerase IV [Clostridia bacterium 41_269]|nr:MAG: DNA polymerase IV [Clostridia bacterium 41_269]